MQKEIVKDEEDEEQQMILNRFINIAFKILITT